MSKRTAKSKSPRPPSKEAESADKAERQRHADQLWQRIRNIEAILARRAADRKTAAALAAEEEDDGDEPTPELPR
jgi:hypothetical protein